MDRKIVKNGNVLLLVPIMAICTFIVIYIAGNKHIPAKYTWIWLLPVSFMACSVLFNRVYLLF